MAGYHTNVSKTISCLPSPSHHHFYRWYVYHSQMGIIVLPALPIIYHWGWFWLSMNGNIGGWFMVYIYICINDIGITTLHFDLAHIWEHRIWLWCPRSWIISFPVDRIASSQRRTSSSWRTRTSSFGFMRPTTATRCGKYDAVQVVPFRIASSHLGSFYIIPNRDPRINPYIYI